MFDKPSYQALIRVQAPEGIVQTITRNRYGAPTAITQYGPGGVGGSVSVSKHLYYNAQQRLCRSTEPETGSTLFGYDAAGHLVWSAEGQAMGSGCASAPASRTTRYYDNMNRLTAVHHPDGKGNISTDYDAMGRVIRATSTTTSGPIRWNYAYDSNGHLTGESLAVDTHTWDLAYAYDSNGALNRVTYPNNQSVAYAPDALGRPTQVGGYVSDISHYPNGGLKRVDYANGTVYQTTRNTRQLVSGLSYTHAGSRQINRAYSYDKNANLVHVNDLAGASDKSFTYDALNRLTAAQAAGLWGNASYVYDALNNLRRLSSDGQVRDYDYVNNRLVAIRRGGTQLHDFRYDAYGNAIGKDSQNRNFDRAHRLLAIPGQASYAYDAAGRRVKATGNQTVYSVYSRGGQLMMQDNVSTGTMTNYIYLGKKPIAQVAGSTTTYVYTNLQGSPLAKANRWGTITARYSYRPYGLQQSGPVNHGPGYTGHVNDPATGLVYMQQRYYDPAVGRFISPDSISPAPGNIYNFNRFAYANDNPLRYTDPTGACADHYANGQCKVRMSPILKEKERAEAEAERKHVESVLNKYDKAVNDLNNDKKYPVRWVNHSWTKIRYLTGAQIKKIWNNQHFTIVPRSTLYGHHLGATTPGFTQLAPEASKMYGNYAVSLGKSLFSGYSSLVFHEFGHVTPAGIQDRYNVGWSGMTNLKREQRAQTLGSILAGSVGAPFNCGTGVLACY